MVQIQSGRLDWTRGRVMVALRRCYRGGPEDGHLTPRFSIRDELVFADPLNLATIPRAKLGDVVEILPEPAQDRVIRAMDEMISRA